MCLFFTTCCRNLEMEKRKLVYETKYIKRKKKEKKTFGKVGKTINCEKCLRGLLLRNFCIPYANVGKRCRFILQEWRQVWPESCEEQLVFTRQSWLLENNEQNKNKRSKRNQKKVLIKLFELFFCCEVFHTNYFSGSTDCSTKR